MTRLSAAVIICSAGRPEILHETLLSVQGQKPAFPSEIIVSVASQSDILPESSILPRVQSFVSPRRGLASQRNAGLQALGSNPDIVVFLDDDVELAPDHLAAYLACFESDSSIVIANAPDLMRGIKGVSRNQARQCINSQPPSAPKTGYRYPDCRSATGSSMAFCGTLVNRIWFDENLPLYSYLEDYDFSLSCQVYGRCVMVPFAQYVHMETSVGRMSNYRRGYSEIVNPFYIASKHGLGLPLRMVLGCIRRTIRSMRLIPSEGVDRLRGHVRGWADVIFQRSDPRKILQM
jgi:GT2 family glycosyltransferase